jgi:hypothetical protein
MKLGYRKIEDLKWEKILRENQTNWHPPLTVHMPIHPVHTSNFVIVDSAFNVSRLRTYPGISKEQVKKRLRRTKNEIMIVQFAFDDPPFVPDCRFTNMNLVEGKYPIVEADYFAWDIHYTLEYFCQPLDDSQNILWIKATVANEDTSSRLITLRAKVSFLPEEKAFDMHYVPFYRDAKKYLQCKRSGISDNRITLNNKQIGLIIPEKFNFQWESEKNFVDKDFNKRFDYETPYFVTPDLRYKKVRQTICFNSELQPGASSSFYILLFTNYENISDSHIYSINSSDYEKSRKPLLTNFKEEEKDTSKTSLEFPCNRWDDIMFRMVTTIKQLLIRPSGEDYLIPTQGGFTARHFVWIWEATLMLLPVLKLGYFDLVRDALSFIFSLQDSGFPPSGRLTTTAGAIGTTGPRWLCTTGSALALAVEYYRYSKDEKFLEEYLPNMFKAANWIIEEIRATRKLNEDGTRPPYYGLMPFGNATDGDVGYIVAKTDSFTFWGLQKFSTLLNEIGNEKSEEISRETQIYKNDLIKAIEYMTRSDGFIERKILTDDKKTRITQKFEYISGAQQLFFTNVLDIDSKSGSNFIDYYERNLAYGPFMGKMDREVVYIGNSEYYWQDIYFRRGEWKKAFLAFQTFLKYGMTEETFLVQERFSLRNPAYTPWQPNGSGSGRIIDMMINSFYFERKDEVVLLAGIPFVWLRDNKKTALKGLYLPKGRVDIEALMINEKRCRLTLSADSPSMMPSKIVFPDHFVVSLENGEVKKREDVYIIPSGVRKVEFILKDAQN